ncbi:LOW QUALITY PROTEIN: platelet glycoprotein Ib beta chain [Salvelinus sp. IW2-2015]|uniref:LOW QUALITY PROTEIN: platelet glycoprotein Ib beta chain n=1 Tax=Salvelinus sp. IW2-2015 TaxID=2691554 RepID=UPI000CDF6846|nr:LOW QUALITY PROTEIN: platelet glycoprotein Ib beta chain [Salvelinus alpinus]
MNTCNSYNHTLLLRPHTPAMTTHNREELAVMMRGFLPCVTQLLGLLLLLLTPGRVEGSSGCPLSCSCHGGQVDCSNRTLTTSSLPSHFPPASIELRLHDNQLTTLPNGLLDSLSSLRSVSLHGNPWTCDCGVLYLRSWLLKQPVDYAGHSNVTCSSPPGLRGRLVVYLAEEEVLESCHYWYCDLALASQVFLFVFVAVQVGLLCAVVVFLRRFERLSREARRTTEESFAGGVGAYENSEYEPLKASSI